MAAIRMFVNEGLGHSSYVIDLGDATLMPGFIDAHVHIESSLCLPAEFARAGPRDGRGRSLRDFDLMTNQQQTLFTFLRITVMIVPLDVRGRSVGALALVREGARYTEEDLGLITPEVDALRAELGYPGMRVVQFAFDGDPTNPHLPENYPENTVAYTGTHDNDTIMGWWEAASPDQREAAARRFRSRDLPVNEAFIDVVFRSEARLAITPIQDVLGLGSEARMNTPGTSGDNWIWRLREGELREEHADRLRRLSRGSDRCRACKTDFRNGTEG